MGYEKSKIKRVTRQRLICLNIITIVTALVVEMSVGGAKVVAAVF